MHACYYQLPFASDLFMIEHVLIYDLRAFSIAYAFDSAAKIYWKYDPTKTSGLGDINCYLSCT